MIHLMLLVKYYEKVTELIIAKYYFHKFTIKSVPHICSIVLRFHIIYLELSSYEMLHLFLCDLGGLGG